MKYYVSYTYNVSDNPFPQFGGSFVDTDMDDMEWEHFLNGNTEYIESLVRPGWPTDSRNLKIIALSEVK